jgi:hypothetical protein
LKTYTQEDINEQYEDAPEPVYCPKCLERGYRILLGNRILQPNEPRSDDYDSWLQCPKCAWLCPLHEMPKEETITDQVETIDNPFEGGKFHVETVKKRTAKTIAKRSSNKIRPTRDKDIQREIQAVGEQNVHIIQDTSQ